MFKYIVNNFFVRQKEECCLLALGVLCLRGRKANGFNRKKFNMEVTHIPHYI